MFGELVALEQHRRTLRELAMGTLVTAAKRPPSTVARGSGCWPGPTADRRGARRHPRGPVPRRRAPGLGGRRGRRLGPRHRGAPRHRGRHLGRGRGSSTASPSASRAACSSWSASGSPPACCSSGTCRSRAAGASGDRPASPRATGAVAWIYEYDEGIDPADPVVRPAAERPLATRAARGRAGLVPAMRRLANLCGLRSPVAQLAEHSAVNRRVVGSSPTGGASLDGGSITGPPSCHPGRRDRGPVQRCSVGPAP